MSTRTIRRIAFLGLVALAPLLTAGAATADPPPAHDGDPALWGPPLSALCANPALAAAAGYNVLIDPLGNAANPAFVGSPAADAMYGQGGNDKIFGASNDDVICGGAGHDKIRGEQGSDALFGEGHNDTLKGDKRRDFLDGGNQIDDCNGGADADAGVNCETAVSIP